MKKSSCNPRRAAAPTARAQRSVITEAQQSGSTRHKRDKRWIFPPRPPPQTETTGMGEGESEHPTPNPRVTQERGTAPPQGWQPRLRIFHTRFSYRAQQELCLRSCESAEPGLLPHLTLQITDDKRAEHSTARVTDLPTFPTRWMKALSAPHRLDPNSHQQRETAPSSVLSPW